MNMNRLIPMLPVANMPARVKFYEKLGFRVEERQDAWGWAMLYFGECRLMVDQSIGQHGAGLRESVIYLYPENIVEYHQLVRTNGLDLPDLETTFYDMTEFRLADPDGNRLWFGQKLSERG